MPLPPPDPATDAANPVAPVVEVSEPGEQPRRNIRAGDLTDSWRLMLGLGWLGAFFAYAGMWQASVEIGIGTWWIGPRAQPTHVLVKLLPFYMCLAVALLIVYNVKWVVRWSGIGVAGAAVISIPDFSRSVGLGIAEAVIAGLLGVITLASLTGRYRAAPAQTAAVQQDEAVAFGPAPR